MNGADAVVFRGRRRARACGTHGRRFGLRFLGLEIDPERNSNIEGDGDVSTSGATTRTLVVRAREDVEVAREVRRVLSAAG